MQPLPQRRTGRLQGSNGARGRSRLPTHETGPPARPDNRRMNPLLSRLHPYPFERLRALTKDIVPNPAFEPIGLGIGEPRHATPELIKRAITDNLKGLASYPATAGDPALRRTIAEWIGRRYGVTVDPQTQVLPV